MVEWNGGMEWGMNQEMVERNGGMEWELNQEMWNGKSGMGEGMGNGSKM